MNDADRSIERLAQIISYAQSLVVLTGAGVSAASGVPTFRGTGGLWREHRPEELATPQAFAADPELVWEFYNWRRDLISRVEPNPAHEAIAALEDRFKDFVLITQNVDGLHRLAGSRRMLELHGCIWRTRCTDCDYITEDRSPLQGLPRCPDCNGMLRPDVVWFNEPVTQIQEAARLAAQADVMLVAGTSAVVQPAAGLALVTREAGGKVAVVNLEPTPLSGMADVALHGPADEILPRVVSLLRDMD